MQNDGGPRGAAALGVGVAALLLALGAIGCGGSSTSIERAGRPEVQAGGDPSGGAHEPKQIYDAGAMPPIFQDAGPIFRPYPL